MKNFKEYSQLNLSEVNKKMLEYWSKHDVFHAGHSSRDGTYHQGCVLPL